MSDSRILPSLALVLLLCTGLLAADGDPQKLPAPQDITLRTNDGLTLVATYYRSLLERDAPCLVLLHAARGNRGDFGALAQLLQREGYAVVAPDLRGHGGSTPARGDRSLPLNADDYQAMVESDLETIKKFLMAKNNAGELNVDKLGIVGVEMGAAVAINWAKLDWSWPVLTTGKQGQDVKALVLISPEWSYKGLKIQEAIADPNVRSELATLIVTGKRNNRLLQEATRLHAALERYHPPASDAAQQTLWLRTPETSLQGTRLLAERSMAVDQMIVRFFELRLLKPAIPWSMRKPPLS